MNKIRAVITGIGGFVPEDRLTNSDLEKMVETNDEWIVSRTGISERRILKAGVGTSEIGIQAVRQLLEKTDTPAEEIDLLICATVTPDMPFPATANIICDEVGAVNAFGYDLSAACSGFLFALETGARFVESGMYRKVIIVGADKMSSIIDYQDRATCIIFGDGGGAVLLEASQDGNGVMDSKLCSDGSGSKFLHMKAGGSRKPATQETVAAREHFAYQEGSVVFKFAVSRMADVSEEIMQRNNLQGEDVAFLVAHQANKRIIDATARRMGVPDEKVLMNIQRYGNTTNGTIPLLLWDFEHKFKKGDNLVLAAFGGGFTWGAMHLRWAY